MLTKAAFFFLNKKNNKKVKCYYNLKVKSEYVIKRNLFL